ncbi:hypothetical protein DL771_010083 [Monosporascus sp. 5C6A]|nr:hypothetical protein DL771_010083 [Monosporascus sp. 5C6A]
MMLSSRIRARGLGPFRTLQNRIQSRRSLHLAPPFLLVDYTPRYQLLSSADAAKKRSQAYAHLRNCNLCPRECGVNRYETTGMCLIGAETVSVNVIAPHFGEEPTTTSRHRRAGFDLTPQELAGWYLKLQGVGGVHNINLVTPEHVVPQVALSILEARDLGLRVPVVYNTSAFDSLASLELLDGLVDIYLPDFKVWSPATSRRLLKADDYAAAATESIKAMHAQVGDLCFTADGIAKKGLLVRHLVMPGKEAEGERIMRFLAEDVSRDTFVNIMEQYRPDAHVGKPKRRGGAKKDGDSEVEEVGDVRYADINRPVTREEISVVRKAAEAVGLWRFCDPPKHEGFAI